MTEGAIILPVEPVALFICCCNREATVPPEPGDGVVAGADWSLFDCLCPVTLSPFSAPTPPPFLSELDDPELDGTNWLVEEEGELPDDSFFLDEVFESLVRDSYWAVKHVARH